MYHFPELYGVRMKSWVPRARWTIAVLRPEASQHEMKQTNVLPCEAA